ncbi:Hypothetical protein NAEGRDRAFT_74787 [Naegleria gruberi]|uniref:F-box domain-containing protein n=1 Tax=Naegleria gruberi TaxID=5762 RepID=D2W0A4_NAEGR|nr:uncharacterized protein NAEGRDRAFT_74787 [Naegleria gruberi]EFC37580.1 Hypothetical protein NAEGRDRAFT_74787 [Naegleria gruberi]|eukprot:XP_002670324.1 Hypothetical protein NAEGRDRAFT_74787 [Naegleria gruberi strain NEG-M]
MSFKQSSTLHSLLIDDILLNVFEFLERSYVLDTISLTCKYLNKLCHQPYNYNRLVWTFSEQYYEKLKRIKPYYTKVQTIEMSDSNKFIESIIPEKRSIEFIEYLTNHKDTIKRLDLNFNRNQIELLKKIIETSKDSLQELSICIFIDTEFAKFACSQLNTFKHLKVLKLIVSNSVQADIILSACEQVLNNGILQTFNSTILLRTENHIQRFIECILKSTLKNISFSLNCEPLIGNNELLSKLIQCLSFGRINVNIKLFNVNSIEFLNKFKPVSEICKEFNISIITINCSTFDNMESLQLCNVYEFSIESGNFTPITNHLPIHVRNLKLNSRNFNVPILIY